MANPSLRIWCNAHFPPQAQALLERGTANHQLMMADELPPTNLHVGPGDRQLADADVAFGQMPPQDVLNLPHLKWIHISTAGYERYDTGDFFHALRSRRIIFTNSSGVYDEPCAQQMLASMLCHARNLPAAWVNQYTTHGWDRLPIRAQSFLLNDQSTLFLGFGAIARRLVELLTPFGIKMTAVRRSLRGDETVPTFTQEHLPHLLAQADHVINTLPGGQGTYRFMNAACFSAMKPTAIFYNVGRGTTVDQDALLAALQTGQLAAAHLDVTDPEPLPPTQPLWTAPRCFITPHTAGGHFNEMDRTVQHFLNNLDRFARGEALVNRLV